MDAPKFRLKVGDQKERRPGEAPRSVEDMAWAQRRPSTTAEVSKLLLKYALMAAFIFVLSFQVFNRRAVPQKAPRTPTDNGALGAPPASNEPSFQVVGADGQKIQPKGTAGEEKPEPQPGEETPKPAGENENAQAAPPAENGAEQTQPPPAAPDETGKASPPEKKEVGRKSFSYAESKERKFLSLLPKFEPQEDLDPSSNAFQRAYDNILDEDIETRPGKIDSNDLTQANNAIFLYIRFLRTHKDNPAKLEEYYNKRKADLVSKLGERKGDATFYNVMSLRSYPSYRGHPYKFQGGLLKKYQIRAYANAENNNAGLRDMWMLICRDLNYRIFSVLVPHDVKHLLSKDEVDAPDQITGQGLFLQRWSYPRADNTAWEAIPVYVALKVQKVEPPPSNMTAVVIALAVIVAIGLFFIVTQMRKDEKQANDLTHRMRERALQSRKKKGKDPTSGSEAEVTGNG